ncbi:thrombopoietin isoform 1-T1 [Odontesthes bonariensis]
MAYSRLLLLLIGVVSTNLPEVHTKPTDFWCNFNARKKIMDKIDNKAQADCVGSDVLPSPVQLPCEGMNIAEWKNKTVVGGRPPRVRGLRSSLQLAPVRVPLRPALCCMSSPSLCLLLPVSLQLSCHWRHRNPKKTTTKNNMLQQKHAEVLEALQVFQHGVQRVRNQTSLDCQASLLEGLERSITFHVNIVSKVHVQNDDFTSSHPPAEKCHNKTSHREVVTIYKQLLRGKLFRLATDLKHIVCKE